MTGTESSEAEIPADPAFTPAGLRGPYVYLRAITPEDYGFLRNIDLNSDIAVRWRFRGSTPGPEQWQQNFWNTVLAQFMVVSRQGDRPVGLVAVYRPNFQQRHAFLAATRFDTQRPSPLLMFGVGMFVDYVFANWSLRKLYMEVPQYNYPQFASGEGHFFEVEGRLRGHSYLAGSWWDELILAIHRDAWERSAWRTLQVRAPAGEPTEAASAG